MPSPLRATLLVLLVGLAALVAYQWLHGVLGEPPIARPGAPQPTPSPAAPIPSELPPVATLNELTETVERPLFEPERRPREAAPASEPVAAVEAVGAAPAPEISLTGIVIEQGSRLALVRRGGADVQRVREGEQVDGWRVVEVRADGITIERGAQRSDIELRTFGPPPPELLRRRLREAPRGDEAAGDRRRPGEPQRRRRPRASPPPG